jgi:hypothetical protein
MPAPHFLYAQVVKSYRRRRIIGVQHCVVFGTREAIDQRLAKRGWTINTACIARLNLDFRQQVAAIGRRVKTFCKHEAGWRQQLVLFQGSHTFGLPHASLRLPLPEVDRCPETGAIQRWPPRTPAMVGPNPTSVSPEAISRM